MRVLATSREPLRVAGEHADGRRASRVAAPAKKPLLARSAMSTPSALLADRARAVDPGFQVDASNAEQSAALCRSLDGIPLAIELAAARLRVLSLEQIGDRLDERFDLLTAGPAAALPRHQTLRGLVDWSYDLCSPAEQALWARMSVFDGGADLEAVESVCGEPGPRRLEVLAGLVDKSVLTATETGGSPPLPDARDHPRVRRREARRTRRDRADARPTPRPLPRVRPPGKGVVGSARPAELAAPSCPPTWATCVPPSTTRWPTPRDPSTAALGLVELPGLVLAACGRADEGATWFARALADEQATGVRHPLAARPRRRRRSLRGPQRCGGCADDRRDERCPCLSRRTAAVDRAARHCGGHLATVTRDDRLRWRAYHRALHAFQDAGDL